MSNEPESASSIIARHPVPWTYATTAIGEVIVKDAAGGYVQLLELVVFAIGVSRGVAGAKNRTS